jgi:hypothetical protein
MTPTTTSDNMPPAIAAAGPAAVIAWEAFLAAEGLKPTTRKLYRNRCLRFFTWLDQQGFGLAAVTRATVESYLDTTGIEDRVIYRTPLRRLFAVLMTHQAIPYDPLSLPTLAEMQAALRDLDPSAMHDNPEMLDAGVVLLAGLHFGTKDILPISSFTGVAPERVAEFAERLRASGIRTPDGETACQWGQEDGEIDLLIDILIAIGIVACASSDAGAVHDEQGTTAADSAPTAHPPRSNCP